MFISFLFVYSKSDMSRLRLAAGSAIMKLAQEPCYHEIITPEQFQLCALVINVSNSLILSFTWPSTLNLLIQIIYFIQIKYPFTLDVCTKGIAVISLLTCYLPTIVILLPWYNYICFLNEDIKNA